MRILSRGGTQCTSPHQAGDAPRFLLSYLIGTSPQHFLVEMESQENNFAWTLEMEGGRQLSCPIWQFVRCLYGTGSLDSSIVYSKWQLERQSMSIYPQIWAYLRDPRDLTLAVEDQIPMANRQWHIIVIGLWPLSMLQHPHTTDARDRP